MPSILVTVSPGEDWFGSALGSSVSSATQFASTLSAYGAQYDEKNSLQGIPVEHLLYLELELPEGATITGVEWRFYHRTRSGTRVRFRTGLIARDGTWDTSGFNHTNYPTFNSLVPFMPVMRPLSTYQYDDTKWHDSRYTQGVHQTSGNTIGVQYTVGDVAAGSTYYSPLTAQLQGFVEDTTSTHRSYSSSGTAIPMLWCWTAGTPLNEDAVQMTYAADWAQYRPEFFVEYSLSTAEFRGVAANRQRLTGSAEADSQLLGATSVEARYTADEAEAVNQLTGTPNNRTRFEGET